MNFLKKYSKLFVSIGLITALLFSGQNIGHAEDQYSEDLIPTMTSNTAPSGVISSSTEWGPYNSGFKAFNDQLDTFGWVTKQGETSGWLAYEFDSPKTISKYTIVAREYRIGESPKDWTFEVFNGEEWVVLDTQKDIKDWKANLKKEFTFTNTSSYLKYRINISSNNGSSDYLAFEEMEMMEKINSTPDPDPNPDPTPDPTGDNALLVIKMISGLEKEFELSASEVQDFIDW